MAHSTLVMLLLLLTVLPSYIATSAHAGPEATTLVSVFSSTYGSSNITDPGLIIGSQFTVDINVDNAPSFNGYEFVLFYDPAFLQAVSTDLKTGTVFNNPYSQINQIISSGLVLFTIVNIGGGFTGGSGTLAHITFKVLGLGVSPLVLAAGTAEPSTSAAPISSICPNCPAGAPDWTRLVSGSTPIDVNTSDGYFSNVTNKQGPVAGFTFTPSSPVQGSAISFNATSSFDPDNLNANNRGIARYSWDFGDISAQSNLTTAGPIVTHQFTPGGASVAGFTGNFSVRLTVIDSDYGFEGMVAQLVTISPPFPLCKLGLVNVNVPEDCPTIGSALRSVTVGGSIQVGPGVYQEDLSVTKTVKLLGAGSGLSTIDGSILVNSARNVTIGGFTISSLVGFALSISGDGSSLFNNTITTGPGSFGGVSLENANHATILNNTVIGSISPARVNPGDLQEDIGILVQGSSEVTLENNKVSNETTGMSIVSSPHSTLRNNLMSHNTYNFGISGGPGDLYQNIDTSNTVDGRPIYYFENVTNPSVPYDAGYLGFVNVQDLTLGPRSISGVREGVFLANSRNVMITGLVVSRAGTGIAVGNSRNVTIQKLQAIDVLKGAAIWNSTRVVLENSFLGPLCIDGISLGSSAESAILNNTVSCSSGLGLDSSRGNDILQNMFTFPQTSPFFGGAGISLFNSTANRFELDRIIGYSEGISLYFSASNTFDGNNVEGLSQVFGDSSGLFLWDSPGNVFRTNIFNNSFAGIGVESRYPRCIIVSIPCRNLNDFVQDIDPTNIVNGRPIYYLVNRSNYTVPSNAGFVAIINSTNIAVENVNLSLNYQDMIIVSSKNIDVENANLSLAFFGIFVWQTSNLTIQHVTISLTYYFSISVLDSGHGQIRGSTISPSGSYNVGGFGYFVGYVGIQLGNSTDFRIEGNYIANYRTSGIQLNQSSNSTLHRNTLAVDDGYLFALSVGISLGYSSYDNLVVGNTIAHNLAGLVVRSGNTIYFNNFIENYYQAEVSGKDIWDNGAGQGNYWSDYNGQDTDGDGVGDTMLPQLGVDNYPLMTPWAPQGLAASFTGRAAWPDHKSFARLRGDDGVQTLFAGVRNIGLAPEWVEAVFNITLASGASMSLVSNPVWIEPGSTVILSVTFKPSPGMYSVTVELKFSSDAYRRWDIAGTKSFSLNVVNK